MTSAPSRMPQLNPGAIVAAEESLLVSPPGRTNPQYMRQDDDRQDERQALAAGAAGVRVERNIRDRRKRERGGHGGTL